MTAITSDRLQRILAAADTARREGELLTMSPDLVESLAAHLALSRERERLTTTIIADLGRQVDRLKAALAAN
jgi:hypothetical protein